LPATGGVIKPGGPLPTCEEITQLHNDTPEHALDYANWEHDEHWEHSEHQEDSDEDGEDHQHQEDSEDGEDDEHLEDSEDREDNDGGFVFDDGGFVLDHRENMEYGNEELGYSVWEDCWEDDGGKEEEHEDVLGHGQEDCACVMQQTLIERLRIQEELIRTQKLKEIQNCKERLAASAELHKKNIAEVLTIRQRRDESEKKVLQAISLKKDLMLRKKQRYR